MQTAQSATRKWQDIVRVVRQQYPTARRVVITPLLGGPEPPPGDGSWTPEWKPRRRYVVERLDFSGAHRMSTNMADVLVLQVEEQVPAGWNESDYGPYGPDYWPGEIVSYGSVEPSESYYEVGFPAVTCAASDHARIPRSPDWVLDTYRADAADGVFARWHVDNRDQRADLI